MGSSSLKIVELDVEKALLELGFVQSHYDYSLYTKKEKSYIVVVKVYMENLLITKVISIEMIKLEMI